MSPSAEVRTARGHTLRIHLDAEPGRLNPLVAPSAWARRIGHGTIFEPLIRYGRPEPTGGPESIGGVEPAGGAEPQVGRYTPRLARSWRVMPSQTEIRVELQPGVTFHDGRPMTSVDVQFTLDAIRDPRRGVRHLRAMLEDVSAVELITSHELRIVLKRPSGYVLRALAEIPILPAHVYDGSLLAGGALVGTGPYRFVSSKAGVIRLARNDRYWGKKPAIAEVEFVHEPDAAVALKHAKRGDFDIVPALIAAHWPEQANAPGIAASFRPLELGTPRLRYLAFNASRPPLDDPRVRQALGLLVDRRTIAKRVFDGLARPALWPIWPGGFVSGPEAPVPEFDPATAGKLLDEAGWTDTDKDGVRDKDGRQLRISMLGGEAPPHTDPSRPAPKLPRDYFVDAARRIGVMIELKTGGDSWVDKKFVEGVFDLAEVVWTGMVDMDIAPLVGGRYAQNARSPRVDRALDALGAAWDPAERARASAELAAALGESWTLAGIVADAPQGLVHKRVQGLRVWDGWFDIAALSFEEP